MKLKIQMYYDKYEVSITWIIFDLKMKLEIQMYYHKYEVSKVAPSKVPKGDSRAAIKESNKIWKNVKVCTLLHLTIENV